MLIREQIQTLVHAIDVGRGPRWLRYTVLALAVLAVAGYYDLTAYRNFNSPEAMDAAQVARNLAEGQGYTTEFIRPFSLYLVSKHNQAALGGRMVATNSDLAQIKGHHPDLANPPVYPLVLAGLMKVFKPEWKVETRKVFWTEGGRFARYKPEFLIAIFNQLLLLAAGGLTFLLARTFFDSLTAWLAAALVLGSDSLWKFSISGQSTLLLLVIFLGLLWCLAKLEQLGRAALPDMRRLFVFAMVAGGLTGLGMLTRYAFGWVIVPVVVFLVLFGGVRRPALAVTVFLAFAAVMAPWIARNLAVSGTWFGTAGYAVLEGSSAFPGSKLMQSINPDLEGVRHFWLINYSGKLLQNMRGLFQGELLRLGGGWMGILFFSGLLLALRDVTARRMRYFTMGCLGVFLIAQALGRTKLSDYSPEFNSENLLVLLTPLVVIFGVASFLKLLEQVNLPTLQVRYWAIGLMLVLACQPLIATFLPPKSPPLAYPPYYPPDVQKIAGWTHKDELLMSDVPWAVAWYGDRQCSWTTINSQYQYYQLNDNLKHISGLYLTLYTLDGKLFSECLQGGVDSWGNFVYKTLSANQLPAGFPLSNFPYESLLSGLFLADRQRW